MIKEVIAQGKDLVEAKENARAALGVGELDDVNFEVLHAGSRGILGIIGVKPAKVRAYIEIPDREEKSRRHERPRREKNNDSNRQNNQPQATTEGEHEKAPKKKNKPHNKDKSNNQPKEDKPRTQVIPEAELKMELRSVERGEDMSYDFVSTLISDIGISAEAQLYSCEDGTRRITITGDDASVLIGHHGDTLDALQYLANLASAQKNAKGECDKSRVTIDIEGYRAKREDTLRALARRMANKALRNKRSVMLEPMTAYERRIIHSEIQNIEGVSTNSIGSDNNRKIVIYLTDKKPKGIFEEDTAAKESASAAEDVIAEDEIVENTAVIDQSTSSSDECDEVVSIEQTAPADEISTVEDDFDDIK